MFSFLKSKPNHPFTGKAKSLTSKDFNFIKLFVQDIINNKNLYNNFIFRTLPTKMGFVITGEDNKLTEKWQKTISSVKSNLKWETLPKSLKDSIGDTIYVVSSIEYLKQFNYPLTNVVPLWNAGIFIPFPSPDQITKEWIVKVYSGNNFTEIFSKPASELI